MIKIKNFAAKDRWNIPLLVKNVTKGVTNKGAPYLSITFQDNSGTMEGKFWDVKPEAEEQVIVGHVEQVEFEVLEYNRNLQMRVFRVTDIDQSEISMRDYLLSSAMKEQELRDRVDDLKESINNQNMKKIVKAMFEKVDEKFFTYPAASRIHHGYLGGLAEHTLGMADLAEEVVRLYPSLNRDLLIAGVLLHDVGKTAELGGVISSEYTEEGKLLGHISIGTGWLTEVCDEVGLGDSEEAILLKHMVLSHHGKQEYGSPVLPALKEAEVLSLIDNLDARMNTLDQAMEGVKPGQWTQKIFALENRAFYKPKI